MHDDPNNDVTNTVAGGEIDGFYMGWDSTGKVLAFYILLTDIVSPDVNYSVELINDVYSEILFDIYWWGEGWSFQYRLDDGDNTDFDSLTRGTNWNFNDSSIENSLEFYIDLDSGEIPGLDVSSLTNLEVSVETESQSGDGENLDEAYPLKLINLN
jgi:hypothetical protein